MRKLTLVACLHLMWCSALQANDIADAVEHPLISRYPEQHIRWQEISNNRPFRVPLGPVTGYRTIGDWADLTGRVTRTFYQLTGERTASEVFANYRSSLTSEGFTIEAANFSAGRGGADVGSRQWLGVYFSENPLNEPGEAASQAAGTASQGGAGAIVASKTRAAGDVYVVINVEQHAADYVGTLIDIVEVEATETGLVAVDAEAIGRDLEDKGRVVLDGIVFEFDKAVLKAESDTALQNISNYLTSRPDLCFYVVGHTDDKGTYAYNFGLANKRARAVVDALTARFGIDRKRLTPHGVGPVSPVFNNGTDAGRARNRRVELVGRLSCD